MRKPIAKCGIICHKPKKGKDSYNRKKEKQGENNIP